MRVQSGVQRERIRGVGLGSGLRKSFRRQVMTNFMGGIVARGAFAIKESESAVFLAA